jgi:hypothetical protein
MFGVGASDIREVCFVIGVILHHLWLTVFYFMSVATLCIVMNLTKLRSNVQTSHKTEKQIFVITALIKLLSLTGRLTPSGQIITKAYYNETGVMVTDITRIRNSQLDPDAPRLAKICEDIIVYAIHSNSSVIIGPKYLSYHKHFS